MLHLLQRYYWVVSLLTVGVCAGLAGQATVHLVEGAYLRDVYLPPSTATPLPPPAARHSKETTAILERNLFCSTCPPILGQPPTPADDDADEEIRSSLPYDLVATVTSGGPAASFAFVRTTAGIEKRNARGQVVRVFPLSLVAPGRHLGDREAVVDHIEPRRVYLQVEDHLEYLEMAEWKRRNGGPKGKGPPPPGPGRGKGPADLRRGVRKISETRFELDRSMIDSVLADPNAVSRAARLVPSRSPRDGRPNGFKLYAIRPDSVYAAIGLQNGDTLAAINGQPLDNPARAFEMYSKLRSASSLQLSVIRRGKPTTIDYSIR